MKRVRRSWIAGLIPVQCLMLLGIGLLISLKKNGKDGALFDGEKFPFQQILFVKPLIKLGAGFILF